LEIIQKNPLLFIDGAHNQAGIKALTKTITSLFPDKKPFFLVSILKDKQIDKMLNTLKKIAHQIIFTEMPSSRKQNISKLRKNNTSKFRKIANYQKAFDYFYSLLNEKTIGIITGSLLFTAFVKNSFSLKIKNDKPDLGYGPKLSNR
jgi:dihydrofolate synthase/folylpolyglutamate synthase